MFICVFLAEPCDMQHVGSWFPNQGSNPQPLLWKLGVLTTGLPGNWGRLQIIRGFATAWRVVPLTPALFRVSCIFTSILSVDEENEDLRKQVGPSP